MAQKPVQQANSLRPFYLVLGGVAVIGAAFLAYQTFGGGGTAATTPIPVTVSPAELAQVQGIAIGRDDAPVVIYEFADFQCPGCGQFAGFTSPLIKDRLVASGQVKFVYYDFPLEQHPHSFLAARAARCANEQGRFWDFHDVVYARQASWSGLRDATGYFIDLGAEIGLDRAAFESCVRSDRFREEVSKSTELGRQLGVGSTPTLFVNMKRLPNVPTYSQLEEIVRQEAGEPAAPAAPAEPAASGDS